MLGLLSVEKLDQSAIPDSGVFVAWEKIESVGGSKNLDQISDERSFSGAGFAPQEVDAGALFRQGVQNRLLPR